MTVKIECVRVEYVECMYAAYVPNMRSRSRGDNTSLPIIEEENPNMKTFRICGKGEGDVRERERGR